MSADDSLEHENAVTEDNFFRIAFLGTVAVVAPFAFYHRIRSHTAEKLDRWQEGAFILFGLRLSGIPLLAGVIIWMIEPKWMAWSASALPVWLRWIGLGIVVLGGALVLFSFHHLGKNLTDTVATRKDHALVTTGPYRYVRHPFYLAFALLIVGVSLVAANWLLFLAGCVPFGFIVARTRIEEAKLIERFGSEYRDYSAKTGRFFPRLR